MYHCRDDLWTPLIEYHDRMLYVTARLDPNFLIWLVRLNFLTFGKMVEEATPNRIWHLALIQMDDQNMAAKMPR